MSRIWSETSVSLQLRENFFSSKLVHSPFLPLLSPPSPPAMEGRGLGQGNHTSLSRGRKPRESQRGQRDWDMPNFHVTQQRRKSQICPHLSHWVTQLLGRQDQSAEDQGNLLTWQIINTLKPTPKAEMEALITQVLSKSASWGGRRGEVSTCADADGWGSTGPSDAPDLVGLTRVICLSPTSPLTHQSPPSSAARAHVHPQTRCPWCLQGTLQKSSSPLLREAVKSRGSGHGGTWNPSSATSQLRSLGHRLLRLTLLLCKIGIILPPTFLGFLWGLNSPMQSAQPVAGTK